MSHLSYLDPSSIKIPSDPVLKGFDGFVMFDAYTATTTKAKPFELVELLRRDGDTISDGLSGYHFFEERIVLKDEGGNNVATVNYGGKTHQGRVMVEAKGYRTTEAVQAIRKAGIVHRCTRADSRIDFDAPGVFEALLKPVSVIKRKHGLKGEKGGDWDDFPQDGRTQYLGSTASDVRARLYEAGKCPDRLHLNKPDLTRLELQVRPQGVAKDVYSVASPLDVWGACAWSRDLVAEVLAAQVEPLHAVPQKPLSTDEMKLRWMCKAYAKPLTNLFVACEGDFAEVGKAILDVLSSVQIEAASQRKAKGRR